MENENLIKNIEELVNNISNIQKELYNKRKEKKENFNFFNAIVSGKHEKHHIEKYHSNFIAYLLDPKGSHDFGTLFLEKFLNVINKENPIQDLKFYSLERERQIDNGRFIDISLEYGKESIIFIENKISSDELEEQVSDYYEFATANFEKNKVIGIYLTLKGNKAKSTNNENIICISYQKIIEWIDLCIKDENVLKYSHIITALEQYKNILNKLLNNMNEETTAILKILIKNPNLSLSLLDIGSDTLKLHIIKQIIPSIKEISNEINDLQINIEENNLGRNTTGFWFFKSEWKYCIYFYFDNDFEKILIGIDKIIPDGIKYDSKKRMFFVEKSQNIVIGKDTNMYDWVWVRELTEWSSLSWDEVIPKSKYIFKSTIEKLLEIINLDESIMK